MISIVSGVTFILLLLLTRPGREVTPVDDYYDASLGKYVQVFDVKLRFVRNPLFGSIHVFEYVGKLKYEITAMEFGSHEKVLSQGTYKDEEKKDHREITITEKALLSKRKVPLLKVQTERYVRDFLGNVHAKVHDNGIELKNENNSRVSHYPVMCPSLSARAIQSLKSNSKVEDVYSEGSGWVVVVKDVPSGRLGRPGTDRIRY